MSNLIKGKNLIIKLNGEAVAACRSCSIDMTGELIEIASPTSAKYKEFRPGRIEWGVTSSHLVTHGIMLSAPSLINREVDLTFQYSENNLHTADGVVLYGKAIISQCKIDATHGNLAQGSFVFKGNGELHNADAYRYLVPSGNDSLIADDRPIIVDKY